MLYPLLSSRRLPVLFALCAFMAFTAGAQTFSVPYTFSAVSETGTNADGSRPKGGLSRSGDVLYGTTVLGGAFAQGTVFKVNADGTGFTNLHSFEMTAGSSN